MNSHQLTLTEEQFSVVQGGPLYQLYLRLRLLRPPVDWLHRRVAAFVIFLWLPLALISALDGNFAHNVQVPFLMDLSAHVRFLICVPILIGAEVLVHVRLKWIVRQFIDRDLIPAESRAKFDELIDSAMSWRNSMLVEVVLLALALTGGHWAWQQFAALKVSTWYATAGSLTPAGYWYAFVSLPLFRFLMLRWYFRFVVWYRFLWQVARLPLQINALHPDRAGGLGFMAVMPIAVIPILIAQTVMLSGTVGESIWHTGAKLPQFQGEIAAFAVLMVALAYVPLLFFAPVLKGARFAGLLECGALASQYVNGFRNKWLRQQASEDTLLGTSDIQSLADMGNSFSVVNEMKLLPVTRKSFVQFIVLLLLPLFPLLLTMVPVDRIIPQLIKLLL